MTFSVLGRDSLVVRDGPLLDDVPRLQDSDIYRLAAKLGLV